MEPLIYGYKNPKGPTEFTMEPFHFFSTSVLVLMYGVSLRDFQCPAPPHPTELYPTSPTPSPDPEPFLTALEVYFLQIKDTVHIIFDFDDWSHKARSLTGTFQNNLGYRKMVRVLGTNFSHLNST